MCASGAMVRDLGHEVTQLGDAGELARPEHPIAELELQIFGMITDKLALPQRSRRSR